MSKRMQWAAMGWAMVWTAGVALAQTATPPTSAAPTVRTPAPAIGQSAGQAVGPLSPSTAAAASGPVQFPAVDPKNFAAPSPTPAMVDQFLHSIWGVDETREWRVVSIQPASEQGFVRVEVLVGDRRQPTRVGSYVFLVTPDGKHAVQGELSPFAPQPFEETRRTLQQQADGPARGAMSKDLEFVEFADLQCAGCKAAQSTIDQLLKDYPQARIVYQNAPEAALHPYATKAAEVGFCVRQAKGDPAYFTYVQKVYDTQSDLTADKADATLQAAAVAAGADGAATMTCAGQPAAAASVQASIKLASDLGIAALPTLVVNGRPLPLVQVPYAGLKRLIVYQGQLDGIKVTEQPSLTTLK